MRELVVLGKLVVFRENWLHKKLLENYIVVSRNWFRELVQIIGSLKEFVWRIGRISENWQNLRELVTLRAFGELVTSRNWLGELVNCEIVGIKGNFALWFIPHLDHLVITWIARFLAIKKAIYV